MTLIVTSTGGDSDGDGDIHIVIKRLYALTYGNTVYVLCSLVRNNI